MEKTGFSIACAAGFLSVILLSWHGYRGFSSDWVYGFLAVLWSFLMMMRLMMLTAPSRRFQSMPYLAQKIIDGYREKQELRRLQILEKSFNGSYLLFLLAAFSFAGWQVFCAAFPSDHLALESLTTAVRQFFVQGGSDVTTFPARLFDWGQVFLLLLSLSMMAFVFRSYAVERGMTRSMLLILSGYIVAGFIALAGLHHPVSSAFDHAALIGNGAGALPYLMGSLSTKPLSIFEIILVESGIAGLALLTFLAFIPLGYICLGAGGRGTDWMIVGCGMIAGATMIASLFLTFTPAIGGFFVLCWMAVFLAWGASENGLSQTA